MEILSLIILAIALAMDSFSVSITVGLSMNQIKVAFISKVAFLFALFQGVMPILGWAIGNSFENMICDYDHWVVFGLLGLIGGKMVYEAIQYKENAPFINIYSNKTICALAIATSIDALAVGISCSLLQVNIILSALVIGVVTFLFSILGITIGWKLGSVFRNKIELIGGLLLIAIGIKVVIEHTLI